MEIPPTARPTFSQDMIYFEAERMLDLETQNEILSGEKAGLLQLVSELEAEKAELESRIGELKFIADCHAILVKSVSEYQRKSEAEKDD